MGARGAWASITGYDPIIKEQSLLAIAGGSANTRPILGENGSSLAISGDVIDYFPRDDFSMYAAQSVGVSINCNALQNCFQFDGSPTNCTIPGNPVANATNPGIYGSPSYDEYGAIPNPFQFLFLFKMDSTGDIPPSTNDPTSPDAWFSPNGPFRNPSILTACDVSVNQVEFTWRNGSYTVDNSAYASGFVAGAVFGPTIQTVAASNLLGQVELLSLTAPTISAFEIGLSNLLANGMIARASGLLMPADTIAAATFDSLLITQYPIMPLFILLLLLYVYAILAISLMIAAMLTRSSHLTVQHSSGGPQKVSMLALTQRAIVSPLGVIAALFDGSLTAHHAASRAHASAALDDTALFEVSEQISADPPRVFAGLGGGDGEQPAFGLWLDRQEEKRYTP